MKIIAATKAMVEPVPEFISDEMYIPDITEINPMACVIKIHDLKLEEICLAVAAGVTSKAVTRRAPTTFTMLTTTAAVIIPNRSSILLTGMP